MVTSFI